MPVTGGQDLDLLLGPLAAYLHAPEARVGALERRLSAVPLMTATDAARHTRLNVETILRAVRAGELAVAGYVGRSPRIARDALESRLARRSSPAAPASPQPAAIGGERQAMPSRRNRRRWAECHTPARSQWPGSPLGTHGHVMDERDHAPRLAAVDAIMQARSGPPPERPGLTVSSA